MRAPDANVYSTRLPAMAGRAHCVTAHCVTAHCVTARCITARSPFVKERG
jgi:hypothetical protein